MPYLPSEVITVIFSYLPSSTLLRFRTVSKSLRSLIDSHHFIFLHLTKSSQSTAATTTVILSHQSDLYQVNLQTLHNNNTLNAATSPLLLNHPLMCYSNRINLLGSCNGIISISNVADDVAFWNPSIRKYLILPSLNHDLRPENFLFAARVYGFGYDSMSGDYKLVRISYYVNLQDRTFDSQVKVYSLRINSWKILPNMPYALCCARTMGVYVDGYLHWVVTRKLEPDQPDLIIAFDLRFENFNEVPLPEKAIDEVNNMNLEIDVAVLGGSLCLIKNYRKQRIDVWVMREYGSKDSWCKLFVLGVSHDIRSLKSVKPLGYSRDGLKVLLVQNRRKLFWYDRRSKEISYIRILGLPNFTEGMICEGTLVPPSVLRSVLRSDNGRKQHNLGVQNAKKRRDDFLSQGFKLTL
ncbi:putative F-box domain-containing protein [Lupinus albus]|uniref:Putative F-box domain-containing protein n=1 Tax=Lupinus albus TaxID=3870 RepID=A0A6A4NL51_LUPAL|nr:putative F-box domain-containing protein [Lupinus albus]